MLEEDEGTGQTNGHQSEIEYEIAGYKVNGKPTVDRCPLKFWKKSDCFYPCLKRIAKVF